MSGGNPIPKGTQSDQLTYIAQLVAAIEERLNHLLAAVSRIEGEVADLRSSTRELAVKTAQLEERTSFIGLIAGALSLIISAVAAALNHLLLRSK